MYKHMQFVNSKKENKVKQAIYSAEFQRIYTVLFNSKPQCKCYVETCY